MTTFLISLLASLISTGFSIYLVKSVTARLSPTPTEQTTLRSAPSKTMQVIEHALDVASAFPAAVLTLIAFANFLPRTELVTGLLIIIAVAMTLFFVWFAQAKNAARYRRWNQLGAKKYDTRRLGLLNVVIILANIIGLVLSVVIPPAPQALQ